MTNVHVLILLGKPYKDNKPGLKTHYALAHWSFT